MGQTYKDFDLLILDDNSTDGSRKIIEEYVIKHPEIKTCINEVNSGNPFNQWKRGADLSKGEYIWIAESDDYAEPEFLEKTVKVLAEDRNAGLVFTDSKIVNEQKKIEYLASDRRKSFSNKRLEKYFNETKGRKKSLRPFLENPIVNVSSVLFRRSYFNEAGGVDPSMKFCGDWLLYIKVFLLSGIRYIPEPLNNFRLHAESSFQSHYGSNIFLKEKMKILYFFLKNSRITVLMIYLVMKESLKVLILRLLYFYRLNEKFKIEIPRVPRNATNLINT